MSKSSNCIILQNHVDISETISCTYIIHLTKLVALILLE